MDQSLHICPICCDEVTKDGVRCDVCNYGIIIGILKCLVIQIKF